jgi:hypothetical protein
MATSLPVAPPEPLPFPLQDAEQVLVLCRRHWWFLWPRTIILALFALVPLVLAFWLLEAVGARDDLGIFFWIVAALWLAYWAVRLFLNWYRYRHDIWVVTNQRLIDSYKSHPFNLRVSTADLVNLQDISLEKKGIVPTMLNFGDVVCETAGSERAPFTIAGIPRPEAIQLLIDRERDRERMRRE